MFLTRLLQRCSSVRPRTTVARSSLLASSPLTSAWTNHVRAISAATSPPRSPKAIDQSILKGNYADRTVEELWRERSADALRQAAINPPAHTYTGRSFKVQAGNVAGALRSLETVLARNKVKQTLRMTQRHEKRGEKLRRLRSERWRKQFANAVRQKALLVTKIRKRGA